MHHLLHHVHKAAATGQPTSRLGVAGLAFAMTPATSLMMSAAPEQVRIIAEKSLAGALALAAHYGEIGSQFAYVAKSAWMDSLESSMIIGGVICSVSAIIASLWLPHREKWAAPDSDGPAAQRTDQLERARRLRRPHLSMEDEA
jgi:ethanolamine transporter EutH